MAKKKKNAVLKPWCYYCNRIFDDEKVLIQHQKAKHFKCPTCHKRLNTAGGLSVHLHQVHKETLYKIENAIEGREKPDVEIFGTVGIPEEAVEQHRLEVEGERALKRQKTDGSMSATGAIEDVNEDDLQAQLEAFKQKKESAAQLGVYQAAGAPPPNVAPLNPFPMQPQHPIPPIPSRPVYAHPPPQWPPHQQPPPYWGAPGRGYRPPPPGMPMGFPPRPLYPPPPPHGFTPPGSTAPFPPPTFPGAAFPPHAIPPVPFPSPPTVPGFVPPTSVNVNPPPTSSLPEPIAATTATVKTEDQPTDNQNGTIAPVTTSGTEPILATVTNGEVNNNNQKIQASDFDSKKIQSTPIPTITATPSTTTTAIATTTATTSSTTTLPVSVTAGSKSVVLIYKEVDISLEEKRAMQSKYQYVKSH